MGHQRLGRLPRTQSWNAVVAALAANRPDAPELAALTARAADHRLQALQTDPSLNHAFWLLVRVSAASRRPDFLEALGDLELTVRPGDSALGFVAAVGAQARGVAERHPESGPFGELASLALRRALTETVGIEGRSLFGSSLEDLEGAVRRHATPARFGDVATRFFGDLAARTLCFYVGRELPLHVGPGHGLTSVDAADVFEEDLDRHARQAARVVARFAEDWYSKHDWESGGAIGHDEVARFLPVAMAKLRRELREGTA